MQINNKEVRQNVDFEKISKAALLRVKLSKLSQEKAENLQETKKSVPKSFRLRKFLSKLFRTLIKPLKPIFVRYRAFSQRPLIEKFQQLELEQSRQRELLENLQRLVVKIDSTLSRNIVENTNRIVRQMTSHQEILQNILSYATVSVKRNMIYCGNDRVLIRSGSGYVVCGTSDLSILACLMDTGELELGTRLLLERLVSPKTTFVDIGANIGLHTLAAARAMGGVGKIIAFEPFPPTAEILRESVWLNGYSKIVEIHQAAVAAQSGTATLHLGKAIGHHSLYELDADSSTGNVTEVRVVTLTEVISEGTKIDLIKIDVEGAELEVLKSAKPFIEKNPEIGLIVEFGISHLHRVGISVCDWFAEFTNLGLVYQAIEPYTGMLQSISLEALEKMESINLLFAKPNGLIWAKACQKK